MKPILAYSFILLISFCSKAQEQLNVEEKRVITQEIHLMFSNYHNDIISHGLIRELNYLDTSPDFFWTLPNYTKPLDYYTIKKIITETSKTTKFIDFSWETIKIHPLTTNIASYIGILKCVKIDTTNTRTSFKISESGTLIKREDGWKFLNGQSKNLP